jgi:ERCC4-related helicase
MQSKLGAAPPGSPFAVADGHVVHPYIQPGTIDAREFQIRVAERALTENTLVVVPTGLGKTLIAVLVAAELLRRQQGTVLFLAPTRPLALQHHETLKRLLRDEGLIQLYTGGVTPAKRAELWGKGILVVATPQTVRNDLAQERYDLRPLGLVIFDEAHRAVGDYAYVEIAQRLRFENPRARVLGLTASPGAKRERFDEVRRNLGVLGVEAREPTSEDVVEHVQRVEVETHLVDLTPTLRRIARPFHEILAENEAKLRQLNIVKGDRPYGLGRGELVKLVQSLGRTGFFAGLHPAAMAHYARLCVDYAEVYGLDALRRHLDRLAAKPDPKRNEKSFLNHPKTKEARELLAKGIEGSHPKHGELAKLLSETAARRPDFLAMVFTQYRDTIPSILEAVRAAGHTAERFVGQAARGEEAGLDQEEQRAILDRFARREFRVLVSTSIGEEGIDVPQVDLVVFFDAVPSEIRAIQRRGRTGRTVAGRVALLVTRNSADEGAWKAAMRKEDQMKRLVRRFGA